MTIKELRLKKLSTTKQSNKRDELATKQNAAFFQNYFVKNCENF